MRLVFALVGLLILSRTADAGDDPLADVAALVTRGDALLQRALSLAGAEPRTEAQATALGPAGASVWTVDDQAFERQLYALLDRYRDLPPDARESLNRLVRFDTYVFNGLTDLTFCNLVEARWRLEVASRFLEHARLSAAGHPDAAWAPDLTNDPKVRAACQ